jgi:hypothetical protein
MRYSTSTTVILAAAVILCSALSGGPAAARDRSAGEGGERVAYTAAPGIRGAAAEDGAQKERENSDEVTARELAKGKRGRRLSRMEGWVASLEGDKARIYKRYGHPPGRYREEAMGTVVEKWVYPDKGKTFVFKGNKLIRTY